MTHYKPESPVQRITRMEWYFDILLRHPTREIRNDPTLSGMRTELATYYENGQWLADYTLDELGMLPPDLKRGVLSQDGLYDLLRRLDHGEEWP